MPRKGKKARENILPFPEKREMVPQCIKFLRHLPYLLLYGTLLQLQGHGSARNSCSTEEMCTGSYEQEIGLINEQKKMNEKV